MKIIIKDKMKEERRHKKTKIQNTKQMGANRKKDARQKLENTRETTENECMMSESGKN